MNHEELERLAQQLACPEGSMGITLGDKMNEMNAFITKCSINALRPLPGETILEIGFGNGKLSIPIIEAIGESGHFIGVETSSVLAIQAAAHFNAYGITHASILADSCHTVNIGSNTLDGVIAVNVLYFVEDIETLFYRIHRWIKPGGRVVIGVRSPESLKEMPFTQFGFNIRTQDMIKHAMLDAGFINATSEYYDEGVTQFGELKLPLDTLVIKADKE